LRIPQRELDDRIDTLSRALRESGLRLTHQRLEVVREIAGSDEHPDVETIYRGVLRRVPTISLDTVYRTLAALARLGLVVRLTAISGPARYDANVSRHHHFVCTRCESVRDITSPSLDAVRAPGDTADLGTVECVDVQLRGICHECERKENDRE
jgi:Fur family transcriptional regulator, peroxide stress response regulator